MKDLFTEAADWVNESVSLEDIIDVIYKTFNIWILFNDILEKIDKVYKNDTRSRKVILDQINSNLFEYRKK